MPQWAYKTNEKKYTIEMRALNRSVDGTVCTDSIASFNDGFWSKEKCCSRFSPQVTQVIERSLRALLSRAVVTAWLGHLIGRTSSSQHTGAKGPSIDQGTVYRTPYSSYQYPPFSVLVWDLSSVDLVNTWCESLHYVSYACADASAIFAGSQWLHRLDTLRHDIKAHILGTKVLHPFIYIFTS